jgi:LemA protein
MILILIGAIVLIGLFLLSLYNGLVSLKMKVDEAWSGIDVQLKRRSSLIPNLVETVKGYAAHESGVFEAVTKARSALMSATTPGDTAEANNQLTTALKSLFAVAENYPELKANDNFKQLQSDLSDTEDKVAYSRQFYNSNVLDFNTRIKQVPAVFIANSMGFKPYDFFKAADEEKADVKVQF